MKIGRNDPCHCGSGQKYKKCHATADEAALTAKLAAEGAARAAAAAADPDAPPPPKPGSRKGPAIGRPLPGAGPKSKGPAPKAASSRKRAV